MEATRKQLGPDELPDLRAFLARDPVTHLYILGVLEEFGIVPPSGQTSFAFWGQIRGGDLEAAIFVGGEGGLLIPAAYSVDPLVELADSMSGKYKLQASLGDPVMVDALVRSFGEGKPRIQKSQRLYIATPDHLGPFTNPSLRLAEESDVPRLVPLALGRVRETIAGDRLGDDRASLELRLLHRIRCQRTYLLESQGQVLFTVDIGPRSAFGAELEGLFTAPEYRRRGHATLSLGQLSRQLLAALPRLTVRLDESDPSGKGVLQKVGYLPAKAQKLVIAG